MDSFKLIPDSYHWILGSLLHLAVDSLLTFYVISLRLGSECLIGEPGEGDQVSCE